MKTNDFQKCPLCTGKIQAFFKESPYIFECKLCGIIFDSRASLDKVYYEKERTPRVDKEKIKYRKRNVTQRANLLKKFLKKETSLLDIGCGEGLFLKEIKYAVGTVKGIEPAEFYANYASKQLNVDVRQGVIEDIEFPDDSFDIITMFHVLEHLHDPNSALKKIHTWLKPEGYLVIEVPNIKSPTAGYKGLSWELIIPEHRFHFCRNSIKNFLESNNFQLSTIKTRDFDQYHVGIGKSLRKLLPSSGKIKKKFDLRRQRASKINSPRKKRETMLRRIRRDIQLPLKAMLGWIVFKFQRGDYLFVIAQKANRKVT